MLKLGILGSLEVTLDGRVLTVSAPMERRVLLCLALRPNEIVDVDRLTDAVWGATAPRSASKLLQLYVSHLRKTLGADAIATAPSGYRLVIEPDGLDSVLFEKLLSEGRKARAGGGDRVAAARLRRALALWRGPALADARHLDFASAEASRLEELRLECLEERIDADLALGEHEQVLAELAALHDEHPLRERLSGQLMLALYRSGRQTEALDVFRDVRRSLRDTLGLEPGEALRRLERAILEQRPELAPPVRANAVLRVRTPATPLVGRARELEELGELVRRPDVRLVTLVGAGGSGKTRLGLALAEECGELFAEGAALVELAELRDPALVPAAIAHALGLPEQPAEPLEATVGDWLSHREVLLLVDNFEHLVDAGPLLVELCEAAPRLTVVVTSRRVLHLSGEQVFPVPPLDEDDAVRLFLQRAEAADRAARPLDEEDVRAICRRLDCLPLAIELAAARTRTLSGSELLARLDARLPLLTTGPRDLPARQQTLRDTLAWSIALLSQGERETLAGLSIFVGGFTLEAAESVAAGDVDAVSRLVDHSLLQRTHAHPEPRFVMLETVREYGLELLDAAAPDAAKAHAQYFADVAESAVLYGAEQADWLVCLDAERANLRAALDYAAAAGEADLEVRLAGALWRFWWLRGALAEGRAHLERALRHADEAEPSVVARACYGAAGIAWGQGDLARARELAEQGLQAASAGGNGFAELSCHTVLGLVAKAEGDYERAREHLERSGSIAAELGRERDVITAKMNLAGVAFDSGDHEAAIDLWTDVLAYDREHGLQEGIGIALLNLGLAAFRAGALGEARERFDEAEAVFEQIGFREHYAHALQGRAAIDAAEGDGLAAAAALGRAATILAETGTGDTTFDATLATETEARVRDEIGDEAFEAAFGRATADSLSSPRDP